MRRPTVEKYHLAGALIRRASPNMSQRLAGRLFPLSAADNAIGRELIDRLRNGVVGSQRDLRVTAAYHVRVFDEGVHVFEQSTYIADDLGVVERDMVLDELNRFRIGLRATTIVGARFGTEVPKITFFAPLAVVALQRLGVELQALRVDIGGPPRAGGTDGTAVCLALDFSVVDLVTGPVRMKGRDNGLGLYGDDLLEVVTLRRAADKAFGNAIVYGRRPEEFRTVVSRSA